MIEIKNLKKTFYPGTPEENVIFDGLNLTFPKGLCTAIIGPNGCGKSTLLNIISGSLKEDSGQILADGLEISSMTQEKRAGFIGKVNQDPSMGVAPSLNILENMALATRKGKDFKLRYLLKNTDKDMIINRLETIGLGLEKKLTTKVQFLSGGQRQSLSLLMATVNNPKLLLLDEHTAALDPKTSKQIMDKTKDLIEREGITTLMISHDFTEATTYADRIIMLNKGRLAFEVDTKDIDPISLNQMYNEEVMKLVK